MNDITQWIDNKAELKAVMEQIAVEYPEGHRIRKMTEKIIKYYKEFISNISFRLHSREVDKALQAPIEEWYVPFQLPHEARCLNLHYNNLLYRLAKFHKMPKTPASVKGLIEILLSAACESGKKVFDQTKELQKKLGAERDPTTGKIQKISNPNDYVQAGALINVKVKEVDKP